MKAHLCIAELYHCIKTQPTKCWRRPTAKLFQLFLLWMVTESLHNRSDFAMLAINLDIGILYEAIRPDSFCLSVCLKRDGNACFFISKLVKVIANFIWWILLRWSWCLLVSLLEFPFLSLLEKAEPHTMHIACVESVELL